MNNGIEGVAHPKLYQKGINMVDLMMWIVIAGLLLAVAIQSISYYRQAASIYELQNDVMGAAQTVTAKVASDEGKVTEALANEGAGDSKKSAGVAVVADPGANDADGFVLRATKPEVTDKEVLFLSKQRGSYAPGIHVVAKGTVIAPNGAVAVVETPAVDNGGGSGSAVTFDAIAGGPDMSAAGIRYVNAVLAYDASVANRTDDWDVKYASSEWIERDAAAAELTHYETFVYDTDPYYRIDSGLPALNDDYQAKLTAFNSDETVANQQAMVTAHRAIFAAAVANPIPLSGRVLVPAPSSPEKFQDVIIAAGTGADTLVRVAIPTSLHKPEWTIGAGWLDGIMLGGNTVGIDGDYTYWDVTIGSGTYVTDADGTIIGKVWKAGTYDAFLSATDNRGVTHSMNFRITVK